MNKIIHLTSKAAYESIEEHGIIPRQSIVANNYGLEPSQRVKTLQKEKFYFNAIPEKNLKGWEEYGLMQDLINRYDCKIQLEIDISNIEGILVREHAHFSPKKFLEKHNVDYWRICMDQTDVNEKELEIIYSHIKQYVESTISLEDYKGEFKAPELWIPSKLPKNKIKKK